LPTRIGIELSPAACRIVELDGDSIGSSEALTTRVRSYAILPPSGPETEDRLALLARRSVAVVVWGARPDHLQVDVSNGSYEKMRAEALSAARTRRVDTQGTLADIAAASTAVKGANRQPVMLALASGSAVSAAVGSLVAARAQVRSIVTPAEALLGLARSRRTSSIPGGAGGVAAYIAMDQTATCLALVRDGSLLGARELAWGYAYPGAATASSPAESRRDDLANRLIDELARFAAGVKGANSPLTEVVICGGLPELRTMTVTLMEQLDVEVETLDSLFGIDAERLPEPADEFRERASELRLAWAAAADWNGPINLMRYRLRRNRRAVLARAAVVGGIAAGLGAGWGIQRSQWWQSTAPESVARAATPAALPGGGAGVASTRSVATTTAAVPPRPVTAAPARPALAPATAGVSPAPAPVAVSAPASATSPAPSLPTSGPRPAAAPSAPKQSVPASVSSGPITPPQRPPAAPAPVSSISLASSSAPAAPLPPVQSPPPAAAPAVRPSATAPLAGPVETALQALQAEPRPQPVERTPPAAARTVPAPPPTPFDATLGTILYSAERKLAIVNGRIVGIGDDVNGARIVDITATSVLLRDARNRMRILTLGQGQPAPSAQ